MPENQFSVWSEIFDARKKKIQEKHELIDADIEIIERIFHAEHGGINLHQLTGTNPPVLSAYVNTTRRLLFVAEGSKLALIWIVINHDYAAFFRSMGARFYQQPPEETQAIDHKPIVSIPHFTPTPTYQYETPKPCISYHQKLITLDDEQEATFSFPTPGVIIGDPGSGKSTLCSALISEDLKNPALLDEGRFIVYFSESGNLPAKMQQAWVLDHPITASQPEANQVLFLDYPALLAQFGPASIQGKTPIDEVEFAAALTKRLTNKKLKKDYPFIETMPLDEWLSILYPEFQFIAVCESEADYLSGKIKTHLQPDWRAWAYQEFTKYTDDLNKEGKHYDPNLLVWQPERQPFSSTYPDEALATAPAVNLMLRRLTYNANILFFADPNQQNIKQFSDIHYIINELGVNGRPLTKKQLKVTYRLPATIARVVNALLAMKQGINGGKNEDNQSDHVTCKVDEHAYPGSLQWVQLEKAKPFIHALNERNEVYVVITHPEYMNAARRLFGEKIVILDINNARGQEFDSAVFFQVTNPPLPNTGKQHQKKKRKTVLQLVNEALAKLPLELENNPHLAKPGKVDRRFETYMNSVYIALSRVVRHGYFIEAGDPNKNEFHKRLNHHINKAMNAVNIKEPTPITRLDDILEKARLDLMQGNIVQAKAGFLKAGKSEKAFEDEKTALEMKNAALVNKILNRSNPSSLAQEESPAPKATPAPKAPGKKMRTLGPKQPNKLDAPRPSGSQITHSLLRKLNHVDNARKITAIDANKKMELMALLDDPAWKKELLRILSDASNETVMMAEKNFNLVLMIITIDSIVSVTDAEGKSHDLPFIHYLFINHKEIIIRKFELYKNKFLAQVENAVFEKQYWSPTLKTNINLITIIAQNDAKFLLNLLAKRPELIGHVDWTLTVLENDSPKSALTLITLLNNEDFNRLHLLLGLHRDAFLAGVSIDALFAVVSEHHVTAFDFLLHQMNGIKLLATMVEKLINHPSFDERFTDDFLSEQLHYEDKKTGFISNATRMTLLSGITLLLVRCIHSKKSAARFVGVMTASKPSSDAYITGFAWNAFSNMLSSGNPIVVNTLITDHSDALKGLPESIWHAPIEKTSQLSLAEENYLLMQLVIRQYSGTPMEAFFKEAYPSAHEKALATQKTLLTTHEALTTLQADKMIKENATEILVKNLRNPSTYALYSTRYGQSTVLQWILSSAVLNPEFLTVFANITEEGKPDDFLRFMQHNDINQTISMTAFIKNTPVMMNMPLISLLCQCEPGRIIVRNVLAYDPRQFVEKISLESLIKFTSFLEDPTNNKLSLLHYLAEKATDIFSTICEYSTRLSKAPADYFRTPVPMLSGSLLNFVESLSLPLKITKTITSFCEKHINALCHLFEAAPKAIPLSKKAFLTNPDEEMAFFNRLGTTVNPDLINRFLNALKPNEALLTTLLKKYHFDNPVASPAIIQRRHKTRGLSPDERKSWEAIVHEPHSKWPENVVEHPHAPSLFMQSLEPDGSCPLFIRLFKNPVLKAAFLRQVKILLQANAAHPIGMLFTKRTLTHPVMDDDGHERPLLFSLMQDDDGYAIIEALESAQPDFYERINAVFFYADFYAKPYQCPVSLLFLASNHRRKSFALMLSQNPFIQNHAAYPALANTYTVSEHTTRSALGAVFLAGADIEDDAEAEDFDKKAADLAHDLIAYDHVKLYKNTSANVWFDENHTVEGSAHRYSLFDLMLLNVNMLRELMALIDLHPNIVTLEFIAKPITSIRTGIIKPRLFYFSQWPDLLSRLLNYIIFSEKDSVKLQESAEATLEHFIRKCESLGSTMEVVTFHEKQHENNPFEIAHLLKQGTALARFAKPLPNGATVFSMALKDRDFQSGFLGFLFYMVDRSDQETLTLNFFNAISMNEGIPTIDGGRIPLLYIILCIPFFEKIINTVYKNPESRYFYKNNDLNHWLQPFYQFFPDEPNAQFSHLDLLLSSTCLVETAKLVINFRFKAVVEQCFNKDYLLTSLQKNVGTTTRLGLILRQAPLHALFKMILSHVKNIEHELATLLLEKSTLEEQNTPSESLLSSLKSSPSGREIMQLLQKMPGLMDKIGKDIIALIKANPPTLPSVIPNGVFRPPLQIQYQEASEEEAIKFITASANRLPFKK